MGETSSVVSNFKLPFINSRYQIEEKIRIKTRNALDTCVNLKKNSKYERRKC